jgi:hypothetical protein
VTLKGKLDEIIERYITKIGSVGGRLIRSGSYTLHWGLLREGLVKIISDALG